VPERQFLAKLPADAARLLRIAHELSFARDLETITVTTRTAARDLTGADGVTFVLREPGGCFYADEDAIAPLWKGRRFPLDACIAGWVMTHNTPVVIPDIYADPRVPLEAYRPTFVKSVAIVPVRAPEPIAAIGAYWSRTHRATDDQVGAMTLLADSAALALTNVQLYGDLAAALDREKQARITAEAATAAKDEFLALVAHELRQPLHASLAALRIMAARNSRASGEHARSVVERQVVQMTRLVEDLLDAARIVRGHVQLNVAPMDVRAVIERAADSLRPLMAERQHELIVSLPELPAVLDADAVRLEQVFANLLTNAAKYTDPGGRITISMTNAHGTASITIADTGRGIEPAALSGIFDLFARGASDVRGFGVGLAVTRRLVELHGGTIHAWSAGPGRGSEFVVSLPLAVTV
jgi:two-component system CheB/CheR fusion protein